jgi:hypothetical protein
MNLRCRLSGHLLDHEPYPWSACLRCHRNFIDDGEAWLDQWSLSRQLWRWRNCLADRLRPLRRRLERWWYDLVDPDRDQIPF